MQRRAQNLSAGRSQDLRRGGARAEFPLEFSGERHERGEARGEVEGGEDREGIAECEEGVAGEGDAALRDGGDGGGVDGSEHAGEMRIFVEA